jgi:aspartyl protease family protein
MMHVEKIFLRIALILYVYILLANNANASQAVDVKVQALFTGKAVLMIDGQRRVLAVGQTSPEGVKLLKSDSNGVTLEIDGVSKDYILGSSSSYSFKKKESVEEQLFANERGMFLTTGTINGQVVRFLLDTGATTIAMNTTQAKKLSVRYRIDGELTRVSTASSFVKAYRVKLKSVSVGKIKVKNVEAMVIDGEHPGPILLGMSFLNQLKVEKTGNVMKLQQKK